MRFTTPTTGPTIDICFSGAWYLEGRTISWVTHAGAKVRPYAVAKQSPKNQTASSS